MRLIVTGGSGILGHCLMALAVPRHQVFGSFHTHPVALAGCSLFPLDITKATEVQSQFNDIRPDVIVHTAALTDVDECEKSPELARRINSEGTAIVAQTAAALDAHFVYVSTDYVFDGACGGYVESDRPNPINQYGASKLLGERYAHEYCPGASIVRTTMFGLKVPPQTGTMESMVAALLSGKTLMRFTDQFFTPLYAGKLSEIILRLAEGRVAGVFHAGSADRVSRYDFSLQAAEIFTSSPSAIVPAPFRQINGLARRPQDTSLVSDKIKKLARVELPTVRDGLAWLRRDWRSSLEEGTVRL